MLHRPGGEVHQVLRLVRVSHQSAGALGAVHQPQAGGQGTPGAPGVTQRYLLSIGAPINYFLVLALLLLCASLESLDFALSDWQPLQFHGIKSQIKRFLSPEKHLPAAGSAFLRAASGQCLIDPLISPHFLFALSTCFASFFTNRFVCRGNYAFTSIRH